MSITKAHLIHLFAPYGRIQSIQLNKKAFQRYNRRFAFITMEDRSKAEQALHQLNNKEIAGRRIEISHYR